MIIWISAKQEAKNPDLILWCSFQVAGWVFQTMSCGNKERACLMLTYSGIDSSPVISNQAAGRNRSLWALFLVVAPTQWKTVFE